MTIPNVSDLRPADPFTERYDVPVAGGALTVARAGPRPEDADAVVLAIHGVSASHVAWRTVARELASRTRACMLVPDLRGRGRSAAVTGPYGIEAHVRDLTAVLDHARAPSALLAGHSMGAHVAARVSAEHPERAAGVVLVDGGLPLPAPAGVMGGEPVQRADPTEGRMERDYGSAEEYLAQWRAHPAFADVWHEDIEAYARYDMTHDGQAVRCVVSEEAVMADAFDFLFDGATRTAITRVSAPIRLLRAPRGALDDECAVIPREYLDAFAADHPHVRVEHVPDTNHYSVLLGGSPGPPRVAAAIEGALRDAEGKQ